MAGLTKEQIEKEGWHSPEIYRDGGTLVYHKGEYELTYKGANILSPSAEINIVVKTHMMDRTYRHVKFDGECPSINELRLIEKLIKIKE